MTQTGQTGIFTISLDFELYWGMFDKKPLEELKPDLLGVRTAVPSLLNLFQNYGIHATWATVGFLFFETEAELRQNLPTRRATYTNQSYDAYQHLENIGIDEENDPFHYAPSLIRMIQSYPDQEIGSHTFSHYYCLEEGQTPETFSDDLQAAHDAAEKYNISCQSLVFPRNQFNQAYIAICREMGIRAYRGNETSWLYQAKKESEELLIRKILRRLDTYLNFSSHNCYAMETLAQSYPVNIPSSRFLRTYSPKLALLERLRLRRILSDLTYAAQHGLVYHLWWHPQDFGIYPEQNLSFLEKILNHYTNLQRQYGMISLNMGEIAEVCEEMSNRTRSTVCHSKN